LEDLILKTPTPWLRSSTGTWHVWFDGKQRYLGKDEKIAHEKFRKMTNTGVTADFTVRQVIDAYWKWAKLNLAPSTLENRKPILESFKASVKASLKAESLRGHHIEAWIDSCERVKSSTTRSDYITHIKSVMKWAKARGYVERNPIEDMPKPPRNVRQEFLTVDTWPKVLALATDQQFRDFLTVMLSTGARPNEMTRFEARHLSGNRFILPIAESKGRKRSRVVYLPTEAVEIVQRLVTQYPSGPLFRNRRGTPWDNNSIRCRFRRLKRVMKMPKLTATTLRHSYAHYRLTEGQDALTVAKLMGHVDTRMVATRYGHLEQNVAYMEAAANGVGFPSLPSISSSLAV
jgi:integrase